MSISAKVVADTNYMGTRLITLEIELHRFIVAQVNTHKAASRNYQSSRAVPVPLMIDQVRNNPAMPVKFAENQRGMVAGDNLSPENTLKAEAIWREMATLIAGKVEELHSLGVAKEVANRPLEPWMWTRGVITATEKDWEKIFALRIHPDAQPEIQELCKAICEAITSSKSIHLVDGEWHMPYYGDGVWRQGSPHSLQDAIKISSSCTAQVSYRKLDDSLEKALTVYEMLNLPVDGEWPEDPPHFSPTEHIAVAEFVKLNGPVVNLSGNFQTSSYTQYRKILENGIEGDYI